MKLIIMTHLLVVACVGYAETSSDTSELMELRQEYQKKAWQKITPVNQRYKSELESLLKKEMRKGSSEYVVEIQNEIKALEGDSPHLLISTSESADVPLADMPSADVSSADVSLADLEGDWLISHNNGSESRWLIDSEGNITMIVSWRGVNRRFNLSYDESSDKYKINFAVPVWCNVAHGKLQLFDKNGHTGTGRNNM